MTPMTRYAVDATFDRRETVPATAAMTILVADDDPHDQMLFLMAVNDCEFDSEVTIEFVDGGAELLDELRIRNRTGAVPDLVVLDMRMPGVDGHQVLDFIGSDPTLPPVDIGVFSSSYRQQDIDRSLAKGAAWHEAKPSKYEELVDFIRRIVDGVEARRTATSR